MASHVMRILVVCLAVLFSAGNSKMPRKIQGGGRATIQDFPYLVSVRAWGSHRCGGSIISESHVLTAAHCIVQVFTSPEMNIQVLSGTNNQQDENTGQIREVSMFFPHENYSLIDSLRNDIAVLKVLKPFFFSKIQQPVLLPTIDVPINTEVTASGWGKKSLNATTASKYLRQLQLYVISNDACMTYYSLGIIHPQQICALRGSECGLRHGDSGSPLIFKNRIIGVASANSHRYPSQIIPDVFTRVDFFIPWIENIMRRY